MSTSLRIRPTRIAWLTATSALLLWTGSASADAASDAATPGGSAPAAPAPASDPVKDAGERYQRGLTLYADGEFLLALVEFERAYELSPNYRVLYNIGQVRIQLGRYAKGREALEAYLAQGGTEIPAERSAAVNKDLAMLAERTADLQLTSNEAGADISLDGHLVGSSPLSAPLVVDAGEHTLQIHKAGFYDLSRSVTLAGRDHIALDLHLSKLPENAPRVVVERHTERVVTTKPARTSMWVGWAATGTLAVTAGVIGYLGVSKANELESIRTDYGVTRSKLDDTKSSARTLLVISDLTAGAAAVVGGVSLYLTLSSPSAERAPGQRASSQRGPVAVAISPRGLRLVTSF